MTVQTAETERTENIEGISLEEMQSQLDASPEGLDRDEAQNRLQRYGYKEISEKKVHPFLKFLTYFWDPIPWMIEAAAVLSAAAQHWPDFTIILYCFWRTPVLVSGKPCLLTGRSGSLTGSCGKPVQKRVAASKELIYQDCPVLGIWKGVCYAKSGNQWIGH